MKAFVELCARLLTIDDIQILVVNRLVVNKQKMPA